MAIVKNLHNNFLIQLSKLKYNAYYFHFLLHFFFTIKRRKNKNVVNSPSDICHDELWSLTGISMVADLSLDSLCLSSIIWRIMTESKISLLKLAVCIFSNCFESPNLDTLNIMISTCTLILLEKHYNLYDPSQPINYWIGEP